MDATRVALGERAFEWWPVTAYDHPFYKQLRKNDLGQVSHQGGPHIPVQLRRFFPPLPPPAAHATEESFLRLDLFDGSEPLGVISCRWHYQTWDQTRPPESRLTQNIVPRLLRTASVDDFLIFERQTDTTDRYRVTLIRSRTANHQALADAARGTRWGVLAAAPHSLADIAEHEVEIISSMKLPFEPFDGKRYGETQRLMRSAAFRRVVYRAYDWSCAVCGSGLVVPLDDFEHHPPVEPEAAHIIPLAANGRDDIRNGLCLCRRHHWAFDNGLIWVDGDRRWRVADRAKQEPRNDPLLEDDGLHLTEPEDGSLAADGYALEWHRTKVAIA